VELTARRRSRMHHEVWMSLHERAGKKRIAAVT
jgi:hypothetical protein